jgi:hypothetical protein
MMNMLVCLNYYYLFFGKGRKREKEGSVTVMEWKGLREDMVGWMGGKETVKGALTSSHLPNTANHLQPFGLN